MSQEPSQTYRPVSGLAVGGFVLALLFAIGMLAAAAVAFISHLPLQVDILWLLVPLTAAGLSLAGLVQVRKSEGTRVGAGLARWGMGMSVVIGLSYLAYYGATEEALRQQASGFADNWFELLRQRRTYPAFWATLEPTQRDLGPALSPLFLKEQPKIAERLEALARDQGRLSLDSSEFLALIDEFPALNQEIVAYLDRRYFWGGIGRPGRLVLFMSDDLVQFVERWQERARIEAQGVRSWSHTGSGAQGHYQMVLGYRVHTPEGSVDAVVTVLSSVLADDSRRHWQVVMAESGLRSSLAPTDIGKLALELSDSSRRFAEGWFEGFAARRREESYLGTLPPLARQGQLGQYAARSAAPFLAGALPLAQGEAARRLFFPGFADFADGKLLDFRELKADGTIRPTVMQHVRQLFTEEGLSLADYPRLLDPPALRIPVPWRIEGGAAVFTHRFFVRIPPRFACEGAIELATADPQFVAALEGKEGAAGGNPGWWVKSLKLRVGGITGKGKD